MARMREPRFKKSRRLGLNVCGHPKAMKRAGNGQSRDSGKLSDYGRQLLEKQRLRGYYEVMEKQFSRYVKDAMKEDEMTGNALLSRLERRLDNMVYRAGFARSIRQARQMVVHGMIEVGGRKIDRPSYAVSVNEEIVLKEKYRSNVHFDENMKSAITPKYMLVDGPRAVLSRIPDTDEIPVEVDMHLVVEYYSR